MEGILRQIDASDFIIPTDIAQDVGQLKCEAQLFGQIQGARVAKAKDVKAGEPDRAGDPVAVLAQMVEGGVGGNTEVHLRRSEEHTSELQSQSNLVCRLLLEKKKKKEEIKKQRSAAATAHRNIRTGSS